MAHLDIQLKLVQEYSEHIDHYTSYLAKIVIKSTLHIAAQQILNDNCNPKINTLVELSMRQLINNLARSALVKVVNEQKPSSSLCDVALSGNVIKRM
ncbi:hypothetical protein [Wolbachia endosymbiont (group E) of Neria commutata]|uniref:hypothetical protein n=1 Tax=Wolbachia endosymbiont (group E) of Neria commutata TaxID=3066149 RepID=UPI00313313A2